MLFLVCMVMLMLEDPLVLAMMMHGLTLKMIWFFSGIMITGAHHMVDLNLHILDGVFLSLLGIPMMALIMTRME